MNPYRRLPVQGAYNVRDLGGIPCEGGVTAFGKLVRADALGRITPEAEELLWQYGLRTLLDLRRPKEEFFIDSCVGDKWLRAHVSLFNPEDKEFVHVFADLYSPPIEHARRFAQVMTCITDGLENGGVLFHCASGKDRTGMISALILLLLGTSDEDIVADYMVSSVFMQRKMDELGHGNRNPSQPEHIRAFIATMARYGGAQAFLALGGYTEERLQQLRNHVVLR